MKRFRLIKLAGYSLVLTLSLVILVNHLLTADNETARVKKRVRNYCVINQGLVKELRQLLRQRMDLIVERVEVANPKVESIKDEYEKTENKTKKSFLPKRKEETDKQFDLKLKELRIRLVSLRGKLKKMIERYSQIEAEYEKTFADEYTFLIIRSLAQEDFLTERYPKFYIEMEEILRKKESTLLDDIYLNQTILLAAEEADEKADSAGWFKKSKAKKKLFF